MLIWSTSQSAYSYIHSWINSCIHHFTVTLTSDKRYFNALYNVNNCILSVFLSRTCRNPWIRLRSTTLLWAKWVHACIRIVHAQNNYTSSKHQLLIGWLRLYSRGVVIGFTNASDCLVVGNTDKGVLYMASAIHNMYGLHFSGVYMYRSLLPSERADQQCCTCIWHVASLP